MTNKQAELLLDELGQITFALGTIAKRLEALTEHVHCIDESMEELAAAVANK